MKDDAELWLANSNDASQRFRTLTRDEARPFFVAFYSWRHDLPKSAGKQFDDSRNALVHPSQGHVVHWTDELGRADGGQFGNSGGAENGGDVGSRLFATHQVGATPKRTTSPRNNARIEIITNQTQSLWLNITAIHINKITISFVLTAVIPNEALKI